MTTLPVEPVAGVPVPRREFDGEGPDQSRPTCRGRDPVAFVAYPWAGRPGPVPAGLEANARLWYLTGLTDGAAVQVCDPPHREP